MRRTPRQRPGVAESASPQRQPGPRTRFPSLTSIWFSSLRMAQRCCSSPTALSSSRLGLSPKPIFSLPWRGKGQGTATQEPTLPVELRALHREAFPLHRPRRHGDEKVLPHSSGLWREHRRPRRRGCLVLPADTSIPQPWDPVC